MIRHLFATPGNPVRLVKPGDEGSTQPEQTTAVVAEPIQHPALAVATNWWVMTPVLLVALAAALTLHLRVARMRRMPPEERAFRRLARAARVPTKYRVLARRLSAAPGAPPPVAVLLSDGALALAAVQIETKPGSATDKVLAKYLAERGVPDPRPNAPKPDHKRETRAGGQNRRSPTRINTAA